MQPDRIFRCHRGAHDRVPDPPERIVPFLIQSGFYGVSRLCYFPLQPSLVSALVERWRPETHTFHTTQGECTITLEDVGIQLGLPCAGHAVSGITDYEWPEVCRLLLGVTPPANKLDGQRLSLSWLAETFAELPDDASDEQAREFARAYILRLIGGTLMPDKSSRNVYLMYLPLLMDFEECGKLSWG